MTRKVVGCGSRAGAEAVRCGVRERFSMSLAAEPVQ